MDDIAIFYEIIVCRANGDCRRFDVAGANADIYRRLQSDLIPNENGVSSATEFEKISSAAKVRRYLYESIQLFEKNRPNPCMEDIRNLLFAAKSLEEFDEVVLRLEELTRPERK